MTPQFPPFGTEGWTASDLKPSNTVPTVEKLYAGVKISTPERQDAIYSVKMSVARNCLYSVIPREMAHISVQNADAILSAFKRDFPALIGEEVDKRIASRIAAQTETIAEKIAGVEKTALARKSIFTFNGISLGSLPLLEKVIDFCQGVGSAWRGGAGTPPASNIDNVTIPRRLFSGLKNSVINGSRGALNISVGGLAAAAVMAATLAMAGLALDKAHELIPSVPSATKVISVVDSKISQFKISVGPVEIGPANSEKAKTMTVNERAAALLAQNGNDFKETLRSVNQALIMSYTNDGSTSVIAGQKDLITAITKLESTHLGKLAASSSLTSPSPYSP